MAAAVWVCVKMLSGGAEFDGCHAFLMILAASSFESVYSPFASAEIPSQPNSIGPVNHHIV